MPNKYFYYSEEDCSYVQVKRSKALSFSKFLGVFLAAMVMTLGLLYFYQPQLFSPDTREAQLQAEMQKMAGRLERMSQTLDQLSQSGSTLRQAVNLPSANGEEKDMGTGGSRTLVAESAIPSVLSSASSMLDQLAKKIEFQQESYKEIFEKYKTNQTLFECIPAIRPVNGDRCSGFGMRMHPIYKIMKFHTGQDFNASIGTSVYCTGNGVVERAAFADGYGNCVVINHGFGYKSLYAHLSEFKVKTGDVVKRGEVIALSGNTGVSEAPHLHYEVLKDDVKVNPSSFFFEEMTPTEYMKALAAQPKDSAATMQETMQAAAAEKPAASN
jgi:murein DD-endopeptidase MepM/ murein hydrolase activator NlpD